MQYNLSCPPGNPKVCLSGKRTSWLLLDSHSRQAPTFLDFQIVEKEKEGLLRNTKVSSSQGHSFIPLEAFTAQHRFILG